MTIKEQLSEQHKAYREENKEKLARVLIFGLIGIGLIMVSIASGNEAHNNSRDEAKEYCNEIYHLEQDYNISSGYDMCKNTYVPIASLMASIILLLFGVLSIMSGVFL